MMSRIGRPVAAAVALATALLVAGCDHDPSTHEIVAAADAGLRITYPQEGTLFPPEIVAPTFTWEDQTGKADRWYG